MINEEILGHILRLIFGLVFALSPFIAFGLYDKYYKPEELKNS